MSVKKGEAPKKIATELSFNSPAEKFTLAVTYNNISGKEYREAVESGSLSPIWCSCWCQSGTLTTNSRWTASPTSRTSVLESATA